jgi:hypothetical protein
MGGVFGLAGSGAMIALWTAARRRRHAAILVVGLAYAVDQAAKAVLEGLFAPAYVSGSVDLYVTVLQLASWIGFMLYFARRPPRPVSVKT